MQTQNRNTRVWLHILFWVAYILLKGYLNASTGNYVEKNEEGMNFFAFYNFSISVLAQLPFLLIKIPLAYSLFYISEKYLAFKWSVYKAIFYSGVLFLLSIIAFTLINNLVVLKYIYKYQADFTNAFKIESLAYNFFILAFASGIALSIKLVRENLRQKEVEKEIIKNKLETEIKFLKAQTNPHFLFNTLNNIYALARKKSDDTADVVMKLSKLLRFMLYEAQSEKVLLLVELQVIDDFIALERIRYKHTDLSLTLTKNLDNPNYSIAPLVLLPFVENAFKHGISECTNGGVIEIDISASKGRLLFNIMNSIGDNKAFNSGAPIGLTNIKRQLELLYPDHKLTIKKDKNKFSIVLELNLSPNEN